MFTAPLRATWSASERPSRITIPDRAHPFARLVFTEMARQGVTYQEMEFRSNVLLSTLKSWRKEKAPGLATIEATLGALGWGLVPVPNPKFLPPHVRRAVQDIAPYFRSEAEAIATVFKSIADFPDAARAEVDGRTNAHTLRCGTNLTGSPEAQSAAQITSDHSSATLAGAAEQPRPGAPAPSQCSPGDNK